MFYALDTVQGVRLCDNLEKPNGFWLENIAVHPDQQGNRFGNLLLKAVEDFLSPAY